MADIADVLKTYLKTVGAITAIVGAGNDSRIMLHRAKKKWVLPWIVFHVLDDNSAEDLSGPSGVITSLVQIDSYGSSETQAYSLCEAVRTALMVTNGASRYSMGSTYIRGVTSPGGYERDFERIKPDSDDIRWICSRDYRISYSE